MPRTADALNLFVDRLAALAPLSKQEREALGAVSTRSLEFRGNADILRMRPKADHACLVVEGLAARFAQARTGNRQLLALHLVGDMIGLQAVAVAGVHFPVQALCAVKVLCLPLDELRMLAATYPGIARAFWAYTSVDAAVLANWTANLGRKSAQGRTAHLLCEIGLRMEHHGQGSRHQFSLDATQTHLGDALGLTSVHVNRTLKALRESGLISVEGRNFHIRDWARLVAIGEFDADYLQIETDPVPPSIANPPPAPLHAGAAW
jgi:CRP-like cAMP-binding protein